MSKPKPPSLETYLRISRVLLPADHQAFLKGLAEEEIDALLEDIRDDLGVSEDDIAWVLRHCAEELECSGRIRQLLGEVVLEHAEKGSNTTMSKAELAQALPRFAQILPDLTLTELMLIYASGWKAFEAEGADDE
jgi:hypothetical protein